MSVSLTQSLGGNAPLPFSIEATGTAVLKEPRQIGELRSLLGPLVSPLLQDSQGALDLAKVPSTSFEDFRSFLLTQMRVDGIAFNDSVLGVSLFDSYHAVLADSRHDALLRSLYVAASELSSNVSSVNEASSQDGTAVLNARGGRGRSPSRGEGAATPVRPRDGVATQVSVDPEIQAQLLAFTADLIGVSGERFAAHHLRTPEGRARLTNILLDQKSFSHDLRSDLVKGIALSGRNFGTSREAYRRLNQEISVWNYTNTSVTKDELSRATHITLDILKEVAVQQEESQELHLRYLKRPKDIVRFSGLEKELQRTITDEAIKAKAEYIDWNRDNYDPKVALGVKLDELWLTLIDDTRWQQSGSLKTAKNAAFVLKEVEGLREKLGEVNTEAEFLEIAEGIRTLLKGGLGVTGTGTLRSIKDFTASSTVPGMFKDLPEVHRQSYDQLLQYAEELHYAKEMGETIEIGKTFDLKTPKGPERSDGKAGAVAGGEVREPTGGTSLAPGPQARASLLPQVKIAGLPQGDSVTNVDFTNLPNTDQPPSVIPAQWPQTDASKKEDPTKTNEDQQKRFTEAKSQFIHGLKQQKRSLWYQYKQHKALSRGISQAAKLIDKGDIQEIKAGQQALDKIIEQVEAAEDESQLKTQVQALQTQLNADGPLHLAMVAAEMDGTEQLIGLGQTILIIMATRQLGRGMARLSTAIAETQTGQRLANLATQIRQHQLGQSIHRGMQHNVFTWRATKGFALGAWISTAENGIAAATDEVNPEGAHADSWALDALATGAAMGFFTTAASYMGNSIEKNLMQRMMGRYIGSTKAPLRMLGDALAETGEEVVDATLRAKLEDADKDLGFDQFREIAMVSGLGGFTKTGMVAEMLRGDPSTSRSGPTGLQGKASPSPETSPDSLPGGMVLFQKQKISPGTRLPSALGAGLAILMTPELANAATQAEALNSGLTPGLLSALGLGTAILGATIFKAKTPHDYSEDPKAIFTELADVLIEYSQQSGIHDEKNLTLVRETVMNNLPASGEKDISQKVAAIAQVIHRIIDPLLNPEAYLVFSMCLGRLGYLVEAEQAIQESKLLGVLKPDANPKAIAIMHESVRMVLSIKAFDLQGLEGPHNPLYHLAQLPQKEWELPLNSFFELFTQRGQLTQVIPHFNALARAYDPKGENQEIVSKIREAILTRMIDMTSGWKLGSILFGTGAGLAALLTPEIANATADVGGAIATQGFWPGLLTALGVGALGMAAHKSRQGKGKKPSKRGAVPEVDAKYLELAARLEAQGRKAGEAGVALSHLLQQIQDPFASPDDPLWQLLTGMRQGLIKSSGGKLDEGVQVAVHTFIEGGMTALGGSKVPPFLNTVARTWAMEDKQDGLLQERPLSEVANLGKAMGEHLKKGLSLGRAAGLQNSQLLSKLHRREIPAFLALKGWLDGQIHRLKQREGVPELAEVLQANRRTIVAHAVHRGDLTYPQRVIADLPGMLDALKDGAKSMEDSAVHEVLQANRGSIVSRALVSGKLTYPQRVIADLPGILETLEDGIKSVEDETVCEVLQANRGNIVFRALASGTLTYPQRVIADLPGMLETLEDGIKSVEDETAREVLQANRGTIVSRALNIGDLTYPQKVMAGLPGMLRALEDGTKSIEDETLREVMQGNRGSIVYHALHSGDLTYPQKVMIGLPKMLRVLEDGTKSMEDSTLREVMQANRGSIVNRALHSGDLTYPQKVMIGLPEMLRVLEDGTKSMKDSTLREVMQANRGSIVNRALASGDLTYPQKVMTGLPGMLRVLEDGTKSIEDETLREVMQANRGSIVYHALHSGDLTYPQKVMIGLPKMLRVLEDGTKSMEDSALREVMQANRGSIVNRALLSGDLTYPQNVMAGLPGMLVALEDGIKSIEEESVREVLQANRGSIVSHALASGDLTYPQKVMIALPKMLRVLEDGTKSMEDSTLREVLQANRGSIVSHALASGDLTYPQKVMAALPKMLRVLEDGIESIEDETVSEVLQANRGSIVNRALASGDLTYPQKVMAALPEMLQRLEVYLESVEDESVHLFLKAWQKSIISRLLVSGNLEGIPKVISDFLQAREKATSPGGGLPSGGSFGILLTTFGAGLATLLTPEIANATADVGGAMAAQGLWPGLLTALGVSAAGFLAMAYGSSGNGPSQGLSSEEKKLHQIFRRYPRLRESFAKMNWTHQEQLSLLSDFLKADEEKDQACNELCVALTALEGTDWTPEQKYEILHYFTKQSSEDNGHAYKHFPMVMDALMKMNWSSEQKFRTFFQLVKLAESYGDWTCQGLPTALTALRQNDWSAEQQIRLLLNLAKHTGEEGGLAYEFLPTALAGLEKLNLGAEEQIQLLLHLAENAKSEVYEAFHNLPPVLEALEKTRWSKEQGIQFLMALAQKTEEHCGKALEHLPGALEILNRGGAGFAQQTRFLLDLAEKTGTNFDMVCAGMPAAWVALEMTGWNTEKQYQFLTSIAEKASRNTGTAFEFMYFLKGQSSQQMEATLYRYLGFLNQLNEYNQRNVLKVLRGHADLFTQMDGTAIVEHLDLYHTIFKRWPRLGFNLMEGMLEATVLGILPKNISTHRDKVLTFIKQSNGFIPSFYQAYLQEGDAYFLKLRKSAENILNDSFGSEEIEAKLQGHTEEFILGLIQNASPTSGASSVEKSDHIKLMKKMLGAGDLRDHIPADWREKIETFNLTQGSWRLRPGQLADAEGKIKNLMATFRAGNANAELKDNHFIKVLTQYLKSGRPAAAREKLQAELFRFAGQQEGWREKLDRVQGQNYTALGLLEQLFDDRDNLPKILAEALDQIPFELLVGQGRQRSLNENPHALVKSLKKVWSESVGGNSLPIKKRLEILASILKTYNGAEIERKILSRSDLSDTLKAAIRQVLHRSPDLSKQQLIHELLSDPINLIQSEKQKYEYLETQDIEVRVRAVKGPAYVLHALTSGVCIAQDYKLWTDPRFKLLAFSEEKIQQVMGYVQVLETEVEGKKFLSLPGINPSVEFMGMVNAQELYDGMMRSIVAFAEAGEFDGVYIPVPPYIHSNRYDFKKIIQAKAYPVRQIPEVHWNALPKPYPFSQVYVAWEKIHEGKEDTALPVKKTDPLAAASFPLGEKNALRLAQYRQEMLDQWQAAGAQVTRQSLGEFWQQNPTILAAMPPWMQSLMEEAKAAGMAAQLEALMVDEVNISPGVLEKLLGADRRDAPIAFAFDILNVMHQQLEFPTGMLWQEPQAGTHRLRLFPDEIIYRAPQYRFGSDAVTMEAVDRLLTQEEVHQLALEEKRPVTLVDKPQILHDAQNVPPYVVALHDLYHTLKVSKFPLANRRVQHQVRNILYEFVDGSEAGRVVSKALDRFLDGDFDLRPHLTTLWLLLEINGLPKKNLYQIYTRLQEEISDDPIGQKFIETFESLIHPEKYR